MKLAMAIAAFSSVVVVNPVFAGDPPNTPAPAPAETPDPAQPIMVAGTIVSVDPGGKSMVIKVGTKKETFAINYLLPMNGNRPLDLSDLKPGTKVEGCAIPEGGRPVMQTLSVY
jgi:hypothetical protein